MGPQFVLTIPISLKIGEKTSYLKVEQRYKNQFIKMKMNIFFYFDNSSIINASFIFILALIGMVHAKWLTYLRSVLI